MSDTRQRRKLSEGFDNLWDSYDEFNVTKETQLDADEDRRNPQHVPRHGWFYQHDDRTSKEYKEAGKEVDDNEDRRNPQYVPRHGWFYQHDDRTGKEPKEAGKKDHDRYNDGEEAPKSRDELIAVYVDDIRNEGLSSARKRRRYGLIAGSKLLPKTRDGS